jgi:pantoate--beta-alanine ligase
MTKNDPLIVRELPALRRALKSYRENEGSIALIPTMGALHRGHLHLVQEARKRANCVVVSIFINPTQFSPGEDFASYPRTFDQDIEALTKAKTDLVWAPTSATMYPDGFTTHVSLDGAAKAGLEDKFRPRFFNGVATVVAKLFLQTMTDIAVFGEKDYQQLLVLTQMVKDLDFPIRIVGVPTVREKDGLALSSRNIYLSSTERAIVPILYRVLFASASRIKKNEPIGRVLAEARAEIVKAGFALDYLEARHALTLAPITSRKEGPIRLMVAAKIGTTRLIDNLGV